MFGSENGSATKNDKLEDNGYREEPQECRETWDQVVVTHEKCGQRREEEDAKE